MQIGIYEQIINQLFEEKIASIDREQFYIGERAIERHEVAKLLAMYLTGITLDTFCLKKQIMVVCCA